MTMGDPEGLQNYDPEWQKNGGIVSKRSDNLRSHNIAHILSKVGHDPELVRKLTRDYPPWAKRPVVDNGWFDALLRDNVELVTENIERITPRGILTRDGIERAFDLILLCAGFKAERYLWPVRYVGRGGVTLEQAWKQDGARSYLGLSVPSFPNLFIIYGPNGQGRSGGLIKWLEIWSRYAVTSLVRLIESGHRSMEVRKEVFDDYNSRMDEALEQCIWASTKSYYVSDQGRQIVNMPWKPADYYEWVRTPNIDEYVLL
jgi:4-hydroxyacetophenone monooxygenase